MMMMDEENDALKVRHVTVEIKCDAFDSVENENNTENNEKKRKIRIDARKTVKDLKIAASKRLLMTSTSNAPTPNAKPINPKYICFLYRGKVLKEDEEKLEKALGLDEKKLRYLSSDDEEEEETNDENEVKIVHMIVRKSEKELEKEREEREKKREEERRARSSSSTVLASPQPNVSQQQQQQQQQQQSPPPGVVMVSPMVMSAYNAAYNAAFRSLRPNATVVPRSPGLSYMQMNTTTEQPFFQQQENVTSQIGGGDASSVANTTTVVAPDVPQAAALAAAAVPAAAAPGANNGNDDPNVIIDPNQPYQRIVRRGEDGEEIVEVIRVIQFRIDVKLMLKLILITAFACQDASRKKMAMYITVAVIGYLYQTGVLESVWDALFGGYLPPEDELQQGGANAGANNENNNVRDRGNNNNRNNRNGRRQRYRRPPHVAGYTNAMPQTWFGELKIFAYSFLASLFPAWRVPNLQQQGQNENNNNPQRHLHQD